MSSNYLWVQKVTFICWANEKQSTSGSRIRRTKFAGKDALLVALRGENAGTLSPSEFRLTEKSGEI